MAILKDTLIQGACRVIGDAYMSLVMASGFKKDGSSDSYVLLGGGGHALISGLSVNYATRAGSISQGVLTLKGNDDNTPLVIDAYGPHVGNWASIEFQRNDVSLGWIGVTTDNKPYYYDTDYRYLYHTGNKPTLDDVLDGSTRKLSNYALASSVYSPIYAPGILASGPNNKLYYQLSGLCSTTDTIPVQYIIVSNTGESFLLICGPKDNSITYTIVSFKTGSVIDEFKSGDNGTIYFKHDKASGYLINDIEITQLSGPKKNISVTTITSTAYNNISSANIIKIGEIFNSINSSVSVGPKYSGDWKYYKVSNLTYSNLDLDDRNLYVLTGLSSSSLPSICFIRPHYDGISAYSLGSSGVNEMKYNHGNLYMELASNNLSVSLRLIGGCANDIAVEEITESAYNSATGSVVTVNRILTTDYETLDQGSDHAYYPTSSTINIDFADYGRHTYFYYIFNSSFSGTTANLTFGTSMPGRLRYVLFTNALSSDITINLTGMSNLKCPATSFVIPAGYSIEVCYYRKYWSSSRVVNVITWSQPLMSVS